MYIYDQKVLFIVFIYMTINITNTRQIIIKMSSTRRYFTPYVRQSITKDDEKIIEMRTKWPTMSFSETAFKLKTMYGIKINRVQCYQRWKVILQPILQSSEQWTQSEDHQLLELLKQYSIDFYFVTRGLKRRTIKNVQQRVAELLNETVRFIQRNIGKADDQTFDEEDLRKICLIMTLCVQTIQAQTISSVRQQLLNLKRTIISHQPIPLNQFIIIYQSVQSIKEFKVFKDEISNRKKNPLKEVWFNNEEQRLYELFCIHGKNFAKISKIMKEEYKNQDKYENVFLRARCIGIIRDGIKKMNTYCQIIKFETQMSLEQMMKRPTARKILALVNKECVQIIKIIMGFTFKKKLPIQEITKAYTFLKWFYGTKQYKYKSPSQRSRRIQGRKYEEEQLNESSSES